MVQEWARDPGRGRPYRLTSLRARFTRPVVVPDDGVGATLTLGGRVLGVADDGGVQLELSARGTAGGAAPVSVLGQARATLAPDAAGPA